MFAVRTESATWDSINRFINNIQRMRISKRNSNKDCSLDVYKLCLRQILKTVCDLSGLCLKCTPTGMTQCIQLMRIIYPLANVEKHITQINNCLSRSHVADLHHTPIDYENIPWMLTECPKHPQIRIVIRKCKDAVDGISTVMDSTEAQKQAMLIIFRLLHTLYGTLCYVCNPQLVSKLISMTYIIHSRLPTTTTLMLSWVLKSNLRPASCLVPRRPKTEYPMTKRRKLVFRTDTDDDDDPEEKEQAMLSFITSQLEKPVASQVEEPDEECTIVKSTTRKRTYVVESPNKPLNITNTTLDADTTDSDAASDSDVSTDFELTENASVIARAKVKRASANDIPQATDSEREAKSSDATSSDESSECDEWSSTDNYDNEWSSTDDSMCDSMYIISKAAMSNK